jgi:hypothetical protein
MTKARKIDAVKAVDQGTLTSRLVGEGVRVRAGEILLLRQVGKEPPHFAVQVLGEAEGTSTLRNPHRPQCPGPGVHVLEQVPVNGAQVAAVEFSERQGLGEPLRGRLFLKEIQVRLGAQACAVLEDGRPGACLVGANELGAEHHAIIFGGECLAIRSHPALKRWFLGHVAIKRIGLTRRYDRPDDRPYASASPRSARRISMELSSDGSISEAIEAFGARDNESHFARSWRPLK